MNSLKLQIALCLSVLVVAGAARAQTSDLDPATRDLLIQKLTLVYMNISPTDSSRTPIVLRLADLHAERARLNAMKDLDSGCTTCTAGREDREKALQLYEDVLPKTQDATLAKILTQVGHLQEMLGLEPKAIATYERVVKEAKTPDAVDEAHLSLGEVYFKHRNYAAAKPEYAAVAASPTAASRGLAAYRVAWCDFNLGQIDAAIQGLVAILKSPVLSSRTATSGIVQVDHQFQEEVSRDLATFLSRQTVTVNEAPEVAVSNAQQVYNLSPETVKVANVTYLENEVERLGQVPAAIALLKFLQEKQLKPEARVEGRVRLAQLEMEQKLFVEAEKDFSSALSLWTTMGTCQSNDCTVLKARIRKFVLDWNHAEKVAPSAALLAAYQSYLKTFPNESEMWVWSAKVASDQKQYALSLEMNQKAAALASADVKVKPTAQSAKEILENSLLAGIEAAELAKEAKLLDSAYNSYLTLSVERKKALEVQYQKAHLIYDRGDQMNEAATEMRAVALSDVAGAVDIKKQAADLSLDALVLLKDDSRLEAWSTEYAKKFPGNSAEFASISRKSVLTQSTAAVGGTAMTPDTAAANEKAWAVLARFDLTGASDQEKAAYYKNKLILAEKLGRYADARTAADRLLTVAGLTAADQQYALSRKAWLAELVLDFDTALTTTEKITDTGIANDQKLLKLAMYAELAAKDPKPFYAQYLKTSKDEEKNTAIAAQFVRGSKEPLKEIEKNKAVLAKRPELLATLYFEIYAQTGLLDVVRKALAMKPSLAATSSGRALSRALLLDEFAKHNVKIANHKIDSANQKKLTRTLKERMAYLATLEKIANKAVESGDWISEVVTLNSVAHENDRFYQEVLSLPVPAGLSTEDEQQYLQLLSQQAAPHRLKADDVGKKVSELWANTAAVDQIAQAMQGAGDLASSTRVVLLKQLPLLIEAAPAAQKPKLLAVGSKVEDKKSGTDLPTLATIESARQAVRENPMNRSRILDLLAVEKRLGSGRTMVAYLEGRLQTLPGATHEGENKK